MSKRKRNTDNLDPERGDKTTLTRNAIKPLFGPKVDPEIRRDIFEKYFAWFSDEPEGETPHLEEPLGEVFLQMLINNQKQAVADYIEYCDSQRDRKLGKEPDKDNDGKPQSTKVNQGEQYNNNDNDNGNTTPLSLSGGSDKRGGHKPPVCTPLSVGDAKKTIKQFVPENIANLHGMMTANGKPTVLCSRLIRDKDGEECKEFVYGISSALHPEADDDDEASEKVGKQFDYPLLDLASQIEKKSKWKLALAKAYADAKDPTTKVNGKPIRNRDAFIMARMEAVTNALKTLEAADGKSSPSEY